MEQAVKNRRVVTTLIATLILVTACNLPSVDQPPAVTMQTAAALTVQAVLNQPQSSPTAPPLESTQAIQNTPTAEITATPAVTTFKVSDNTNCRKGPGEDYALVTTIKAGTSVQMVARDSDGKYWVVAPPGVSETCWVANEFGTASGNYASLPVVTPFSDTHTSGVPARPGSLYYTYDCSLGNLKTVLTWKDNADNESGYRVYRNGSLIADLPANSTTYTDETTIVIGASMNYALEAYNGVGASPQRTISFIC